MSFKILLSLFFTLNLWADSANLSFIIENLASEKFEGRRAGTIPNEMAAEFIASELKNLNVSKSSFTIFTEMEKDGENSLSINGRKSIEFTPISYSESGKLENSELVFVGYGITVPKSDHNLKYDDYEGIDVTGKVVVVLTGDPAIKNPDSPFRTADYLNFSQIHYKLKNAINHGAKGLLLVSDPLSNSDYPTEVLPEFNQFEGGGDRFNILAGRVAGKTLNSFLGHDKILELQNIIRVSQKPASISLGLLADLSVSLKRKTGRVSNVIVKVLGTDPLLKNEVVVVGAHFDHLGLGGDSSMELYGKIHYGADDNGSGVALVMELAKKVSMAPLKRTHYFVFFNAEEIGVLGSAHFVQSWDQNSSGKLVAMLNFDMVGRYSTALSVMGVNSSIEWRESLPLIPFELVRELKGEAVPSSDHASFLQRKIPSLSFTTGSHNDYHTSRDTADKINYPALFLIENYAYQTLVVTDQSSITYNNDYQDSSDDDRNRGYGAHLGCAPDFAQPDGLVGVRCARATPGSPAEKIGMTTGDIVTSVGDVPVNNVYDLVFVLKYYRAGDTVLVQWIRDGVVFKKEATLTKKDR